MQTPEPSEKWNRHNQQVTSSKHKWFNTTTTKSQTMEKHFYSHKLVQKYRGKKLQTFPPIGHYWLLSKHLRRTANQRSRLCKINDPNWTKYHKYYNALKEISLVLRQHSMDEEGRKLVWCHHGFTWWCGNMRISYLLHQMREKFPLVDFGLYRDDGLGCYKKLPGPEMERTRKEIIQLFKANNLSITIDANCTKSTSSTQTWT